jgi:hypothetical protein
MSASHLVVVPNTSTEPAPVDPLAQRIRDLRIEARALAHEHVERLHQSLLDSSRLAAEIAEGGDAYPIGAREFARRLVDEASHLAITLAAIVERERD